MEKNNKITDKKLHDAVHFAKSMIGSGWPKQYANQRAAEYYGVLTEEVIKYTKNKDNKND
jgi:hypothetical protein